MSMREIIWKLRDRLESLLTSLGLSLPGKVMYIGGSDTLPAPLEREAEAELIARLERGDRGARDLLIEHNLRLVAYIARRFENTGINIEDLISIGRWAPTSRRKALNWQLMPAAALKMKS